jgi:hypothetical protein
MENAAAARELRNQSLEEFRAESSGHGLQSPSFATPEPRRSRPTQCDAMVDGNLVTGLQCHEAAPTVSIICAQGPRQ